MSVFEIDPQAYGAESRDRLADTLVHLRQLAIGSSVGYDFSRSGENAGHFVSTPKGSELTDDELRAIGEGIADKINADFVYSEGPITPMKAAEAYVPLYVRQDELRANDREIN